jgi:hypothetical protein
MARCAYEFASTRSLYEMQPILDQAGPWRWGIKDCAWYPDFILCRLRGRGTGVREWALCWLPTARSTPR